jgi:hypothetical protein
VPGRGTPLTPAASPARRGSDPRSARRRIHPTTHQRLETEPDRLGIGPRSRGRAGIAEERFVDGESLLHTYDYAIQIWTYCPYIRASSLAALFSILESDCVLLQQRVRATATDVRTIVPTTIDTIARPPSVAAFNEEPCKRRRENHRA